MSIRAALIADCTFGQHEARLGVNEVTLNRAQGDCNEMRTLPQVAREAEQETKVVVLFVDEHYRTAIAHWPRGASRR
jgi:hypothetical protein